jgi:hypothetical protein
MRRKLHEVERQQNKQQGSSRPDSPMNRPNVRVLLYCFKPPLPSAGGFAAASAGGRAFILPVRTQS